jgi:hypothetical protein
MSIFGSFDCAIFFSRSTNQIPTKQKTSSKRKMNMMASFDSNCNSVKEASLMTHLYCLFMFFDQIKVSKLFKVVRIVRFLFCFGSGYVHRGAHSHPVPPRTVSLKIRAQTLILMK